MWSALGAGSSVTVHLPPIPSPASWPLIVGAPPLLASSFQHRPALTAAIDEARAAGSSAVLAQVLSGGGGMGKSQLAAAYARDAVRTGTDLVLWAAAADMQQLIALYARAAALVQAPGRRGDDPVADAQAFLAWLTTTSRSWMIVLDDVTDPAALAPWWPAARPGTGWVLATSRLKDSRLTGQGRTRVDVDVYTPAEAGAYLEHRLSTDAFPQLLDGSQRDLAEELGYLPLALGHAAAYLINQQMPCAAYLALLRARERNLDDVMPQWADTENYGRQVTAALLLSRTAAQAASPRGLALPVLQLAALLDPAGQPAALWNSPPVLAHLTDWLSAAPQEQPLSVTGGEVRESLLILHRYGLLTYDSHASAQEVRIHALTARAVQETTPSERQASLAHTAADALLAIWPDHHGPHHRLAAALRANTHVLAHGTGQHLWDGKHHHVLLHSGASLMFSGHYHVALTYLQDLLAKAKDALGPEHIDVHETRACLAATLGHLGRHRDALPLKEQVLAYDLAVNGEDHPDTLSARATLAETLQQLARDDALPMKEQVLDDHRRVLGEDHPDTLHARNNLAASYGELGRYDDALPLLQQVLTDSMRTLGTDHVETHISRHNLAALHHTLGRNSEALPLVEQSVEGLARLLGASHPHTTSLRETLAAICRDLGQYDRALEIGKQVVADRISTLGSDHPDTPQALHHLADTYESLGNHDQALQLRENVLADCIRLHGKGDAKTHIARANLALTYSSLGRHSDALPLQEQALTDTIRNLGEDHPDSHRARHDLAMTYSDLGRDHDALPLQEQVLTHYIQTLGEGHADAIAARTWLAATYSNLGRHNDALSLEEQVLAHRVRTLGEDHPDSHRARHNLAVTYSRLGRDEEALPLREQLLAHRVRTLGADHPDTIDAGAWLAISYVNLGRYDDALPLQEQFAAARARTLGDDHPDTVQARDWNAATSALARHDNPRAGTG
ncbi:FxSxx-COOH system tetratricopeptide repeat protein [Streptomyces wedmorensis]